jgi:two-component system sensor histidine kinase/response regulator
MSQLITDLLDFSKQGRAEIKRSPVGMNNLVTGVINDLKAANPNFNHAITVKLLADASADRGLIQQVWVNLIGNAIKYSSNKPNPVIEIGMQQINNENVYYVKDNGAGFDMKNANKLFTAFQRLHRASDFEGTGVGLALVHQVITRHGGRVWAEAKVDEGATFYFTLPAVG